MTSFRLIPLDDTVIFPGMSVTLSVDPGEDTQLLLVPRRDGEYAKVGVVAEVLERVQLAGRGVACRSWGSTARSPAPRPPAATVACVWRWKSGPTTRRRPPDARTRARIPRRRGGAPPAARRRRPHQRVRALDRGAGALADTAGYSPDFSVDQKIDLLETLDVVERLTLAVRLQKERLTELHVRKRIREDVESGAQKQQRDYFLHRQMDAIRKELGQNEASVAEEYPEEDRGGGDAREGPGAG